MFHGIPLYRIPQTDIGRVAKKRIVFCLFAKATGIMFVSVVEAKRKESHKGRKRDKTYMD